MISFFLDTSSTWKQMFEHIFFALDLGNAYFYIFFLPAVNQSI